MAGLLFAPQFPWLAPLAGWSDLPFRLLCRELGAAVCCTEMISAKGLVYGGRNTRELLDTVPADQPLVAQIFGAEPEFMADAVGLLQEMGFVWFDINMGCSVPKVTKTGAGAALLHSVRQAVSVAGAVIKAAGPGRAGLKMRLGWHQGEDAYREIGLAAAELGAGWLTLHPRSARQGFDGQASHAATAGLARLVPIPVLASGDLLSAADGARVLKETGAAGVMYARGALRDPAIFARHRALPGKGDLTAESGKLLSAQALAAMIHRHIGLAREFAPRTALLKMRTVIPRYVKHLPGAKELRKNILLCRDWDALRDIVASQLGPPIPLSEVLG